MRRLEASSSEAETTAQGRVSTPPSTGLDRAKEQWEVGAGGDWAGRRRRRLQKRSRSRRAGHSEGRLGTTRLVSVCLVRRLLKRSEVRVISERWSVDCRWKELGGRSWSSDSSTRQILRRTVAKGSDRGSVRGSVELEKRSRREPGEEAASCGGESSQWRMAEWGEAQSGWESREGSSDAEEGAAAGSRMGKRS